MEPAEPVAGRYSFTTFEEYVEERWDIDRTQAFRSIQHADAALKLLEISNILPARESHVRELLDPRPRCRRYLGLGGAGLAGDGTPAASRSLITVSSDRLCLHAAAGSARLLLGRLGLLPIPLRRNPRRPRA